VTARPPNAEGPPDGTSSEDKSPIPASGPESPADKPERQTEPQQRTGSIDDLRRILIAHGRGVPVTPEEAAILAVEEAEKASANGNGKRAAEAEVAVEAQETEAPEPPPAPGAASSDEAPDVMANAPVTALIRADAATGELLGQALFDEKIAEQVARTMCPDDFPDCRERRIFTTILKVLGDRHVANAVTVEEALPHDPEIKAHLHTLYDVRGEKTAVSSYIDVIQEATAKRRQTTAVQRMDAVLAKADGKPAAEVYRQLAELLEQAVPASVGDKVDQVPMYSGTEAAAMGVVEAEPVIEGMAYVAQSTYFMGAGKGGGKTTALLDMARCRILGEAWCDQRVKPGGVLYLTEQTPASFNPQMARAGLDVEPGFRIIFHKDVAELGLTWADVGELALRKTAGTDIELVIVDTYPQWVGFVGEEEQGSGPALVALRVVERWKAHDLSVICATHTRKEGGSIYEAARGSTATAGGFDMLARIRRTRFTHCRIIDAAGRPFVEDPDDVVIELDPTTHRYHRATPAVENPRAAILGLFPELGIDHAMPEAAIIAACKDMHGIGREAVSKALRELCDPALPGLMDRKRGAGSAGPHAMGYWRCADREPGQLFGAEEAPDSAPNSAVGTILPVELSDSEAPANSAANSTAAPDDLQSWAGIEPDNSTVRPTDEL
jgi:hypothetical protein